MKVEIDDFSFGRVQSLFQMFDNRKGDLVITRALNRTLSTMKTQVVARIGNELNVKSSRIKKDIIAKKANFDKPYVTITATSRRSLGLYSFIGTTPKAASVYLDKKCQGVRYKLFRKERGKKLLPNSWAVNLNGKLHAMRRYRGNPVVWYGPRVASILEQPHILNVVKTQGEHILKKNLLREVEKALRGLDNAKPKKKY